LQIYTVLEYNFNVYKILNVFKDTQNKEYLKKYDAIKRRIK